MKRKIFSKLLMGAFLIASVSMFVSCKDYDDDISKNAADITALQKQLSDIQSSLTTNLNSAKADLDAAKDALEKAIAAKADATALKSLQDDLTDAIGRVTKLEEQLKVVADVANGAVTAEQLQTAIATVTGQIPTEEAIKDLIVKNAAAKTLEAQVEALEKFQDEVKKANYLTAADLEGINKAIEDLKTQIAGISISEDVDALKKQFEELSKAIDEKLGEGIDAIEMLVVKRLTSIVLKPDFYWEGIEGIEVPFLNTPEFAEHDKYNFYYVVKDQTKGDDTIKVNVLSKVMGWLDTEGKTHISESEKTWNPAIYRSKPSGTSSGISTAYSLIDRDATALVVTTDKKTLKTVLIEPGAEAKYHINPGNADLTDYKYSFYENLAEVYTRGANNQYIGSEVKQDGVTLDKGILTVPFQVNTKQVWSYFYKWAFQNNTNATYNIYNADANNTSGTYNSGVEPQWDNEWFQYVSLYKNSLFDEEGNYVKDTLIYYGSGSSQPSNFGTSNYYDAKGAYTGQDVAPLPFISLTAEKDTTVNSDYAVVVPAIYNIVALADSAPNTTLSRNTFYKTHGTYGRIQYNHLYETVGVNGSYDITGFESSKGNYVYNSPGAIPSPATHEVVYDSLIDLKPFIETHYSYTTFTRYGQSTVDKKMDAALMAKLGLHYEFKKIDYTIGKNETSESAHIQQIGDETSGVFAPRSVNADGTTILDKVATVEAVDREPLIRVDLVHVDKAGNKHIVRYGYIKLRIVDTEESYEDIDVTVDLGDVYMNCGDQVRMTWSQVENLILAKLNDGKGMKKQDFESIYYLVNEGSFRSMPTNANGGLYDTANRNRFWAKRWYRNAAGDVVEAAKVADKTHNEANAVNEFDFKNWTKNNNWFGRVWYTPHDNSTTGHDWDEATNVLIWDLHGYKDEESAGKPYYGNMKDKYTTYGDSLYRQLIKVSGATYASKGLSTDTVSTIVRFQNKNTQTYVNVTLRLLPGKIHFAYGDINRRVLDHWFDFKTGYKDMTPDTIEVYANVPTPAEAARPALGTFSDASGVTPGGFKKDLTEYWLGQKITIDLYNAKKFTKFANNDITFQFRLPKEGENADFSADSKGQWTANGASGTVWTVQLNATKDTILAVKKGGKDYAATPICALTPAGQIHWLGRNEVAGASYLKDNETAETANQEDVNEPANDILNYIGYYDAKGNSQKSTYLSGQKDKTFTAFVEILISNDACYDPLIGKNYFNVRFLRPINVWPAETFWQDAPNTTQIYDLWKLLYIRDWRTYAVVMDNQSQKFDDQNHYTYEGKYVDGAKASVPYSFYNITNLYVERKNIKSDAYLPASQRSAYLSTDKIEDLLSIDEIPALTGKNTDGSTKWEYFKIVDAATTTTDAGTAATGKKESTASTDKFAYTNNGGVVKEFHIFVPVSVVYSHGALKPWTQTVWAVITIDPTVGNE